MTIFAHAPATAPVRPAAVPPELMQQALGRLLQDTLTRLGTLDVTDRHAVNASLNLLERLLAVLEEPAPELAELALGLRCAAATSRAALAASLYRALARMGRERLGLAALPLLDD